MIKLKAIISPQIGGDVKESRHILPYYYWKGAIVASTYTSKWGNEAFWWVNGSTDKDVDKENYDDVLDIVIKKNMFKEINQKLTMLIPS